MGRKKLDVKGVRFSVFLHEGQLKLLDAKARNAQMTRSKFIEFSCGLGNKISNKLGDYGKGESKCKTE